MYKANFENILKVLEGKKPDKPTLFEFFLNNPLYRKLADKAVLNMDDQLSNYRIHISAFKNAGYDYVTYHGSEFNFPSGERHSEESISLNEGGLISNRKSFEEYSWPDPDQFDYSRLKDMEDLLPEGMKIIVHGPGGVLENVISLVGYESLCYLTIDDPDLVKDLFDEVGSRLNRYYQICSKYDTVGAMIVNDDWGFKSQTMLSLFDMRKYVFPWHKKIVKTIHSAGKPAILHSCGNLESVMEDIIEDMQFDAKHSFEDTIIPVEEAYEKWGSRIAILGGIDLDFICRATPAQVKERSIKILEQTKDRGGYALGTGNSVPEYVPDENYFAMISAVGR